MASDAAQKEQLKKQAREKWNFWLGKLEAKFVRGTDTFLGKTDNHSISWQAVCPPPPPPQPPILTLIEIQKFR